MNHPTTIREVLVQHLKDYLVAAEEHYTLHPGDVLTPEMFNTRAALQDITRIVEGVIGENDGYNDMCEHCNNWDEGRNDLLNEQADRLRKVLK